MGRLDGKVAFITGAAKGIGRATATLFAEEGASVAVADIDREGGEETVALINDAGRQAIFLETNVSDEDSVQAAVAATVEAYGKLTVLHNNAGGSTRDDGPVTKAPTEEFWRAITLDLFGTWVCSRYAIPEIEKAGGGAIINMTSYVALRGTKGMDAYTTAKGGIAALTRSMAVEYAASKIRVNAIAPAITQSDRVLGLLEGNRDRMESFIDKHLFGLIEPADIARTALFLASDDSSMTTGQIFGVDSGATVV